MQTWHQTTFKRGKKYLLDHLFRDEGDAVRRRLGRFGRSGLSDGLDQPQHVQRDRLKRQI